MSNLKFNYDKQYDILYISIGAPRPSYSDEVEEGIIIRKDFNTNEITGVTVLDFMKRLEHQDKKLDNLPLPEALKDYDIRSIININ